jgi:hypothetical protein
MRQVFAFIAILCLLAAGTNPALAGCRKGTFITFKNNTKYCVWATLYYSYVMQAGWKIERAHEVQPHDSWMSWIAFNYPDLRPQIGARAEVMNHQSVPCKAAPNVGDVRVNEDVPMAKINNEWNLSPREATINGEPGRFTIAMGLGPQPGNSTECRM